MNKLNELVVKINNFIEDINYYNNECSLEDRQFIGEQLKDSVIDISENLIKDFNCGIDINTLDANIVRRVSINQYEDISIVPLDYAKMCKTWLKNNIREKYNLDFDSVMNDIIEFYDTRKW